MSATKPYQFQPKYSKDELSEREKVEKDRQSRLQSRENNKNWCTCGGCQVMPTPEENLCCREQSLVKVLIDNCYDISCITEHPKFERTILDQHSLNILRYTLSMREKNVTERKKYDNDCNRLWRHLAYRQFCLWINSWNSMRKYQRLVLPSCVVNTIRDLYPEDNGLYVGFHEATLHEIGEVQTLPY